MAVHYNNKRTLVGRYGYREALLKERISELIQLLEAYRKGIIKEKEINKKREIRRGFLICYSKQR